MNKVKEVRKYRACSIRQLPVLTDGSGGLTRGGSWGQVSAHSIKKHHEKINAGITLSDVECQKHLKAGEVDGKASYITILKNYVRPT